MFFFENTSCTFNWMYPVKVENKAVVLHGSRDRSVGKSVTQLLPAKHILFWAEIVLDRADHLVYSC